MTAPRSSPSRLIGCVLVIDDQPDNRRALGDLLASRGHRVLEAADGKDGLGLARHERPDVILLELALTGTDGYAVCRQLKADPLTASIPVLLLTSHHDRDARLTGMRAGANDFVVWPIDDADLLLRVRNGIFTHRLFERQERQYRRLQELEALRDSLVHLVIHDLRSPLAGVQTYLELLRLLAVERSDQEQQKLVGQALLTLGNVTELMNTVLDVSRLEEGKMPLRLAASDLRVLLSEALQHLGPQASGERVDVRGQATTMCDAGLIRRVLMNLVGNALKFSPESGTVRITLAGEGGGAIVRVSDSGPGIRPEDRERVFEKFGQVGALSSGGGRHGAGLGLAFCKMTVEAHGGRIGVESEPGHGASFWFSLPGRPPPG